MEGSQLDGEYIKACGFQNPLVYHLRDWTDNHALHRLLSTICVPFGLVKSIISPREKYTKKLAAVAIAKNEAAYLKEWVEFYKKQGFDNIVLFDNDSTDDTVKVLEPYIRSGFIIYHKIHGKMRQYDAYHIAVAKYKHVFKYITFIDCDEFMFCKSSSVFEFADRLLYRSKMGVFWSIGLCSGHQAWMKNQMVA